MTPGPCFDPREAATVAELPDAHPLRRHASECPRCRALLDAYRAFTEADPSGVAPADLADADARLSRALAGAISAPAAGPSSARDRSSSFSPGHVLSFWQRFLHPAMRPAVGFAAIALVLGVMVLWPRLTPRSHEVTLRGESHAVALTLARAERSGDAIHLAWNAVPGAENYELRFLSGHLTALGRVGPLSGTSVDLPLSALGIQVAADETLLVRVAALAAGDAIATSGARLIESR